MQARIQDKILISVALADGDDLVSNMVELCMLVIHIKS